MTLIDTGHFDQDGLWVSDRKKYFASWLSVNHSKPITITGRKVYKGRSNNQNRYYWGVVLSVLSQHTGHTQDELHEILKYKFNRQFVELGGKHYPVGGSTTELETIQFEEYLEKVRLWAVTELGCEIPLPNE